MKLFRSVAHWPIGFGLSETTTDDHDTFEQADNVCKLLRKEGYGGNKIIFPILTTVKAIIR